MVSPLKVGIAGLGTVGAAVVRLIARSSAGSWPRAAAGRSRSSRCRRAFAQQGARHRPARHALGRRSGRAGGRSRRSTCFVELMGGPRAIRRAAAVEAALQGRQAGGHRQQGAARPARRATGQRWPRSAAVALNFEAAVGGAIPIVKTLREGLAGNSLSARLRHPQRHLQLHPDADGAGGLSFADMPEGRAAARLCRGRSDLRRRRLRHRAEAGDPGEPRLRHQGRRGRDLCRGHLVDRAAKISAPADELGYRIKLLGVAVRTATGHRAARASDHGAEIVADRAGDGRDQRGDHRRRGRRRRSRWWAPAPAAPRPRRRWSPTSPTSRAASGIAPFGRPVGEARATGEGADAAPRGRLLHPLHGASTGRAPPPTIATRLAEQQISLESIVQRHRAAGRRRGSRRGRVRRRCRSS